MQPSQGSIKVPQTGGPRVVASGTHAAKAQVKGGGLNVGTPSWSEGRAPGAMTKIEAWIASPGLGLARSGAPWTSILAPITRRSVTAEGGRKLPLHATARQTQNRARALV
jgi:hypothetical protein